MINASHRISEVNSWRYLVFCTLKNTNGPSVTTNVVWKTKSSATVYRFHALTFGNFCNHFFFLELLNICNVLRRKMKLFDASFNKNYRSNVKISKDSYQKYSVRIHSIYKGAFPAKFGVRYGVVAGKIAWEVSAGDVCQWLRDRRAVNTQISIQIYSETQVKQHSAEFVKKDGRHLAHLYFIVYHVIPIRHVWAFWTSGSGSSYQWSILWVRIGRTRFAYCLQDLRMKDISQFKHLFFVRVW